jgi:polyisoprenoid-binding protein YceI
MVIVFAYSTAHALTLHQDATQGAVEFHATGVPSLLHINGKGTAPSGDLQIDGTKVTGTLTADLTTLDSGISLRDHHMKEKYLEVGKFPNATLKVKDVTLPATWTMATPEVTDQPFKGLLTMHGVEKPIEGTFSITKAGAGISTSAKFNVQLSNYGIEIPKYLGITIKDDVPVEILMSQLKPK